VYNVDIELMALSTEMQEKSQHVFLAFPSDILITNGCYYDFHSFEIRLDEGLLNKLNDAIGIIQSERNFYVTYILNSEEITQVDLQYADDQVVVSTVDVMCNKSGLFAKVFLTKGDSSVFYFLKLVNYT
jgi:hypothetical protein